MDNIDRKIIEILRKNARSSYKEIAKNANITDVAVLKRIKKLEENIIRGYVALVDQRAYGKEITAIISIRCEAAKSAYVAEEIAKLEDISEVYITVGDYDVVAKIRTTNLDTLKDLVEKKISMIRGINEIRTNIVFNCIKEDVSLVCCKSIGK